MHFLPMMFVYAGTINFSALRLICGSNHLKFKITLQIPHNTVYSCRGLNPQRSAPAALLTSAQIPSLFARQRESFRLGRCLHPKHLQLSARTQLDFASLQCNRFRSNQNKKQLPTYE